ncbi:hypothetical protein QAD02_002235 [Eretmocerus hayati]|uniref:Uncharacterized protein n=1 Tax=Eretmocerus hayati TaxID=131215 RepID=A0ACC2NK36_9HYME|nr:hypothetical protein QAD02_002235 [Eretmocerus hayati]
MPLPSDVRHCVVPGCESSRSIPSYKFPKKKELGDKWIAVLNCPDLGALAYADVQKYRVCYEHFPEDAIRFGGNGSSHVYQVPSLHLPDDNSSFIESPPTTAAKVSPTPSIRASPSIPALSKPASPTSTVNHVPRDATPLHFALTPPSSTVAPAGLRTITPSAVAVQVVNDGLATPMILHYDVKCDCRLAVRQFTLREGPHQGKTYVKCQKPVGSDCSYFTWLKEAPAGIVLVSPQSVHSSAKKRLSGRLISLMPPLQNPAELATTDWRRCPSTGKKHLMALVKSQ